MKKYKIIFYTPIVFLPIALTSLISAIIGVSIWWLANFIYALSCWLTFVILFYILKNYGISLRDVGWKNFKISDIWWAILFFVIGIYVWWIISIILIRLGIEWEMRYSFASNYEIFIMFFFAVITAPICEETFFRGFLITVMNFRLKLLLASLLSIFLFALYHLFPFGIGGFIHILFWAPLPTILFIWRKSIYPAIIMHFLNNLYAWVILPLIFK